ncbi:hypothetical protein GEV39_18035 [Pseudomonas sp. NY5710]|uniref:hypothetical protein n=1 Tax=Pseudomonas sp. NY5710 TaxID=2662033 RepID=UPI00156E2E72|nr:hypothetical protein [Pseudomonas sp. NY5710]QKL03159.1 hypothetical protein GEV39_18035 [Pseudomonas sp. NY5710]
MRPTPLAQLPLPTIPALLPNIPGGQPNLLPVNALAAPLRVEVVMWLNSKPTPAAPETLNLYWNKQCVHSKTWEAPIGEEELFVEVPVEHLVEGEHEVFYEVVLGDGNPAYCEPLPITIDLAPPELPQDNAIHFPEEVIQDGVSDRYLKAHDDLLQGNIAPYDDAAPGDVVKIYWGEAPDPKTSTVVDRYTLTPQDLGQPLRAWISGTDIRDSGEGGRWAWYGVQDRAGNLEHFSIPKSLYARATPRGRVLPAPTLVEAEGGASRSILRPNMATQGATVRIPDSADIGPNESIEVFWGKPGEEGSYKPQPLQPDARLYHVPPEFVAIHIGKRIELYYELTERETEKSPAHTLTVDNVDHLPTPQSDAIDAGILNLTRLGTGKASLHSAIWPFIATSQFIKIELYGRSAADGSNLRTQIGEKAVVSTQGRIELGEIDKDKLALYKRDETLRIEASISFDNKNSWQPMPIIFPLLVD